MKSCKSGTWYLIRSAFADPLMGKAKICGLGLFGTAYGTVQHLSLSPCNKSGIVLDDC